MIVIYVEHEPESTTLTLAKLGAGMAFDQSTARRLSTAEVVDWVLDVSEEWDVRVIVIESAGLGGVVLDAVVEAVPEGVAVISSLKSVKSSWA